MAEARVLGSDKKVALDAAVFGVKFNEALVHECVIADLASRRQGTHSTRTRGQVSGGGAKPFRQKGTGRARAGSSRSPIWTGGGTVFGPSPRHYTVKVNRKARRAALRCALSVHADRGSIFVVEAGSFKEPSAKQAHKLIVDQTNRSIVLVLSDDEATVAKSFRNIPKVKVLSVKDTAVADLIGGGSVVFSHSALDAITTLAAKPSNEKVAA